MKIEEEGVWSNLANTDSEVDIESVRINESCY